MEGKNWLKGAWDLHIHVAPDVVKRKCTERVVAQRMHERGMSGGAIKCHFFETIARASLANEDYPDIKIVGGITLNRSVGGLNPEAVLKAGMMGGKCCSFRQWTRPLFRSTSTRATTASIRQGL